MKTNNRITLKQQRIIETQMIYYLSKVKDKKFDSSSEYYCTAYAILILLVGMEMENIDGIKFHVGYKGSGIQSKANINYWISNISNKLISSDENGNLSTITEKFEALDKIPKQKKHES